MKKYEPIDDKGNELKIEVYYDKGGINYFTYKTDPRGYWLSIRPVQIERRERSIIVESYPLFSGVRRFLLEVKKKSAKAEEQALALAEQLLEETKQHALTEYNNRLKPSL